MDTLTQPIALPTSTAAPPASAASPRWEYCRVFWQDRGWIFPHAEFCIVHPDGQLTWVRPNRREKPKACALRVVNQLGAEGWELVGFDGGAWLRRAIPAPASLPAAAPPPVAAVPPPRPAPPEPPAADPPTLVPTDPTGFTR
jgi:hypothetical protein